ncbi:MAG: helix-turn-helix domain-containing protein [Paludibacter sp.]|nr:helix-turn-helix domain-containing protein [Paludibacter sp.]
MEGNIVVIVSFLAVFNLVLLSVISWFRSIKNPAYFWLAWIFFPPALAILSNVIIYQDSGNIILYHISSFLNVSWGGFLYLFIHSLRNPELRKLHFDWRFFIPSLLYIPYIVLTIIDPWWAADSISKAQDNQLNYFTLLYNLIICLYAIVINIILLIGEYREKPSAIKEMNKAKSERKEMLAIMLILLLCAFVPFLINAEIEYIILYMPVFGQIFFIYMFLRLSQSTSVMIRNTYENLISVQESTTIASNQTKYASIRIEEDKVCKIIQEITDLMDNEKPYIAMNYSISDMSKKLDILPNILSMVINTRFNTNFPDFINSYRIQHALNLLTVFEERNLTIESVAYESGFSNRTSFYNAFKKQTGKLPSEYIKRNGSST